MEELGPRREQWPRDAQAASGVVPSRGIRTSLYVRAADVQGSTNPGPVASDVLGNRSTAVPDAVLPPPSMESSLRCSTSRVLAVVSSRDIRASLYSTRESRLARGDARKRASRVWRSGFLRRWQECTMPGFVVDEQPSLFERGREPVTGFGRHEQPTVGMPAQMR